MKLPFSGKEICAVVTTMRPRTAIEENVKRVIAQVGHVILINDSGIETEKGRSFGANQNNIEIIFNTRNSGIAKSLNTGVISAIEQGYHWILTLDDDTLISEYYITDVIEFMKNNPGLKIGLVTLARRTRLIQPSSVNVYSYALKRTIITSGAIFSAGVFRKVNGFDESYFIDIVDFDFCTKIRKSGYLLIQINKTGMEHRVGNSIDKKIAFGKVKVYNHLPFRHYYQIRNVIFFCRKYIFYDFFLSIYLLTDIFRIPIKTLLFENQKFKRLHFELLGIKDGLFNIKGKLNKTD